jgi:flagellar motor switch protein FliG
MGKTVPEVLERVAAALRERAHAIGQVKATEIDGRAALAAILRQVDPSFGDRIVEELEETDGDLGRELKEKLYTLDDVISADDRSLAAHLRSMADRDIAILLKGRSAEFVDKIKANLSSSRRAMVEEEQELLGPLPRREVEQVGRDFMAWFRLGREQGRIILVNDEDVLS